MRELTTVREVLVAARNLITPPWKWTKGRMHLYRTRQTIWAHCSLGAIDKVLGHTSSPLKHATEAALTSTIVRLTDNSSIIAFNDNPRTRKRDVLRIFDKAIEEAS